VPPNFTAVTLTEVSTMNDEERQRTMDFILRQQAQFTAPTQRIEEEHAQFSGSRALFLINKSNGEDIAALAKVVADMACGRNGDNGTA
jgi:hypothetical protein